MNRIKNKTFRMLLHLNRALLISFLYTSLTLCQDFWEAASGPEGGWVQCIAADNPGNLYIGFDAGWFGPNHHGNCLYKSTDEGMSWESLSVYSNKDIESIVVDTSGTIFLWEGGVGVLRSSNGGLTWTLTSQGIDGFYTSELGICRNNTVILGHHNGVYISTDQASSWVLTSLTDQIRMIFVDDNDNIFAGTTSGAIYRSSDYGSSWIIVSNGMNGYVVNALSQVSDSIFYAGTDIGIYKSIDDCNSWIFLEGSPANVTTISSAAVSEVYCGTSTDGVFISTDEGRSWQNRSPGLPNKFITAMLTLPARKIVIGTYGDGMFISLTQGQCWQPLNNGLRSVHITAMLNYNDYLFTGSQEGILYKSSDKGNTWMRIDSTYTNRAVTAFLSTEKNTLLYASWDYPFKDRFEKHFNQTALSQRKSLTASPPRSGSAKIFRSEDQGNTWRESAELSVNSFAGFYDASSLTEYLLAGTDDSGIMISTDDGMTWYSSDNGQTYIQSVTTNSKGYFFAATCEKIYRSTDFGISWQTIYSGDPYVIFHTALHVSSNDYLYAGFEWGKVILSTDDGDTWHDIGQNLPVIRINSLTTDSLGRVYAGNWEGSIFQSPDYGESWINIESGMIGGPVLNLNCSNDGTIFVGPYGGSIYRGINSTFVPPQTRLVWPGPGAQNISLTPTLEWEVSPFADTYRIQLAVNADFDSSGIMFDTQLSETNYTTDTLSKNSKYYWRVACANQFGWSIWSTSYWFKTINPLTVEEKSKDIDVFRLSQNYPNPFNPSTTIDFSVPREELVNLSVYNILGEKIKELKHEVMQPGTYEVNFDASGLPSGVYIYKIRAGNFIRSEKMLMIK